MFVIMEMKDRGEIDALHEKEKVRDKRTFSHLERLNKQESAGVFRDVHVYDGKGDEIDVPKYSQDVHVGCIGHLRGLLKEDSAARMLDIILHRNNFDPANRVDSADLLVWICTHPLTTDLFYLLIEQLNDNGNLGVCRQGTSHRIRQIYYAQLDL